MCRLTTTCDDGTSNLARFRHCFRTRNANVVKIISDDNIDNTQISQVISVKINLSYLSIVLVLFKVCELEIDFNGIYEITWTVLKG